MDPELQAAIELALENSPADAALRSHLITLLLEDGEAERAAAHAHTLLYYEPDHQQGLALAAAAAQALGDIDRADRYYRIINALQGEPATPARAHASQIDEAMPTTSELDSFLASVLEPENRANRVTLDDVGGLDEVKARLRASFLGPLKNPELRAAYGANLRGGLLLWGPPGCGKTFLARALAGELDAAFISIALHDVLDMWLGNSEKNMHELFQQARRAAPCVLFFDEVDAIGMKRTERASSAGRGVITQLLNELDGVDSNNDGLFVLGATNAPWDVDPALRRPGRFDRTMLILPPDTQARTSILEYHCSKLPTEDVDFANLASRTSHFSGADLAFLCKSASETAMIRAASADRVLPITMDDFEDALTGISAATGPWFSVAANYATYANKSGEYDELLKYIRKNKLS